jgi:EpsI family protein
MTAHTAAKNYPLRSLLLGIAMVSAAGLAIALQPTTHLADTLPKFELEKIIPREFADWRLDNSIVPVQVSPDVQAKLDQIYSQVLTRTYVNGAGERVMLSIAYGGDQSGEATHVHRPEFCYVGQGFKVTRSADDELSTPFGQLPVRRLVAVKGPRQEPITYWITMGDHATLPGAQRKLLQIAYGLTGNVPDGMLVRVSSLTNNNAAGYALQARFIRDMISSVDATLRPRVVGRL